MVDINIKLFRGKYTICISLILAVAFVCTSLHASPTVTTSPATSVGAGVVTLNATVNPNSSSVTTYFYFEYGLTTSYGSITAKSLRTGTTPVNISNVVAGLQLQTPYHFRAVATNSTGNSYGSDQIFTTTAATTPTITTNSLSSLGATNALLSGKLYPNGLPTGVWFKFGLTTNYGNASTATNLSGGTTSQNFRLAVGNLAPGATYYYCAVATNGMGTNFGIGQSFTTGIFGDVTAALAPGLPGFQQGAMAWGDFQNDGKLGFLLSGALYTNSNYLVRSEIWRNLGDGFTNVTATIAASLPADYNSPAQWGDYDNDGHLDLLFSAGPRILHNTTGSNFVDVTATVASGLPQISFSAAAWGDYDNDGKLDFILTGQINTNGFNRAISQIWHNTGSNFVEVSTSVAPGLTGVSAGAVAWADYDNDGWLDLLLAGNNNGAITRIWHNTGSNFVDVTQSVAPGLPGQGFPAVAWGDYDNDGFVDFIITGTAGSQIWHNTGSDFVDVTATMAPGLSGGSVAWGDYDNDGRLDLLLSAQIWHNTGSNFVNVTTNIAPGLTSLSSSSVAWCDFDNDGRLDFLIIGSSGNGPVSQIWRNFLPQNTNTLPTAPTGLAMTSSTNGVLLSWKPATDNETPPTGLSYNVCAGTDPRGTNLVAFHSDTSGFRQVPAMGNAGERLFLPLAGASNGEAIYWSVQAVDSAFAGGPFSTQCNVVSVPQLKLSTDTLLSWTPPTWGWHLQESPNSLPGSWSDSVSGETNPVTIYSTNAAKFYRLVTP